MDCTEPKVDLTKYFLSFFFLLPFLADNSQDFLKISRHLRYDRACRVKSRFAMAAIQVLFTR